MLPGASANDGPLASHDVQPGKPVGVPGIRQFGKAATLEIRCPLTTQAGSHSSIADCGTVSDRKCECEDLFQRATRGDWRIQSAIGAVTFTRCLLLGAAALDFPRAQGLDSDAPSSGTGAQIAVAVRNA